MQLTCDSTFSLRYSGVSNHMPPDATQSSSESLLREKLIDDAREGWKNRLIDLSQRNNLLFYKPLVSGTLELPLTARVTEFLKGGVAGFVQ